MSGKRLLRIVFLMGVWVLAQPSGARAQTARVLPSPLTLADCCCFEYPMAELAQKLFSSLVSF